MSRPIMRLWRAKRCQAYGVGGSRKTSMILTAAFPSAYRTRPTLCRPMSRVRSLSRRFNRPSGSDIHLMLALCCRSRQVVMANEELNGTDMVGELLGKRQRRAYQTRNALSQRVVEPFNVIGFAR